MPRETQSSLPGRQEIKPTQATPGVKVVANQGAAAAPVSNLTRLAGALEGLQRPAQNIQAAYDEVDLARRDLEGKTLGIQIASEAQKNIDEWSKSEDPVGAIQDWHLERMGTITDAQQRKAASGYILNSINSMSSHILAQKREELRLQAEDSLGVVADDQFKDAGNLSTETVADFLQYAEQIPGMDRRTAGKVLVQSLISRARAEGKPDLLNEELLRSVKIDDQPLEVIYREELIQGRTQADLERRRKEAAHWEEVQYQVTSTVQDAFVNGTLTEKMLNWAMDQGMDPSTALAFRMQHIKNMEDAKTKVDLLALGRAGQYTEIRKSEKNIQAYLQAYAENLPADLDQEERILRIVTESQRLGDGIMYEPLKQQLEYANPASTEFEAAANMWDRLSIHNRTYALSMVDADRALMFDNYLTLIRHENMSPAEARQHLIETSNTQNVQRAYRLIDDRAGSPYSNQLNKLMEWSGNDFNLREEHRRLTALAITRNKDPKAAAEFATDVIKANYRVINGRPVHLGRLPIPQGIEEAATAKAQDLGKELEKLGIVDPEGFSFAPFQATYGEVKVGEDADGNPILDRPLMLVRNSTGAAVTVGGVPFVYYMNKDTEEWHAGAQLRANKRNRETSEHLSFTRGPRRSRKEGDVEFTDSGININRNPR